MSGVFAASEITLGSPLRDGVTSGGSVARLPYPRDQSDTRWERPRPHRHICRKQLTRRHRLNRLELTKLSWEGADVNVKSLVDNPNPVTLGLASLAERSNG